MSVEPTDERGRPTGDAGGFFETLRGAVLTSIPALSALVFVIVAVKGLPSVHVLERRYDACDRQHCGRGRAPEGVIRRRCLASLAGIWPRRPLRRRERYLPMGREAARGRNEDGAPPPPGDVPWAMPRDGCFTIWWPVLLILSCPFRVPGCALGPLARERARRRGFEGNQGSPLPRCR